MNFQECGANLLGECWVKVQQLALVGSSSSLHYEACNALGASDGVIHSRISLEGVSLRASSNRWHANAMPANMQHIFSLRHPQLPCRMHDKSDCVCCFASLMHELVELVKSHSDFFFGVSKRCSHLLGIDRPHQHA